MKLQNKVVLVTGASKGIGAASAVALAQAGAHVVLAARSLEMLSEKATWIRERGGKAMAVRLDVTSDTSVAEAVSTIQRSLGRIDVVVNNAGNGGDLSLWLDQAPQKMRETMEVHLFGTERVTRAVLPAMIERREGMVVNVVSAIAWAPMPAAAGYCSAKAAVLAFSQALRGELTGTGVRVLVFAPGHTKTTESTWPLETGQVLMPEDNAKDLVRSITQSRATFISGISNRNLVRLHRLWPGLAANIITKIGLSALQKSVAASNDR